MVIHVGLVAAAPLEAPDEGDGLVRRPHGVRGHDVDGFAMRFASLQA